MAPAEIVAVEQAACATVVPQAASAPGAVVAASLPDVVVDASGTGVTVTTPASLTVTATVPASVTSKMPPSDPMTRWVTLPSGPRIVPASKKVVVPPPPPPPLPPLPPLPVLASPNPAPFVEQELTRAVSPPATQNHDTLPAKIPAARCERWMQSFTGNPLCCWPAADTAKSLCVALNVMRGFAARDSAIDSRTPVRGRRGPF